MVLQDPGEATNNGGGQRENNMKLNTEFEPLLTLSEEEKGILTRVEAQT